MKNKYLKTQSFDLTAYLLSEKCELAGIEKDPSNDNKFIFCFYNTDTVMKLTSDFFSLRAFVKPQDFLNAERTLRSIIRSNLSGFDDQLRPPTGVNGSEANKAYENKNSRNKPN